jgi:cysteinyl-tRNA synthetase
MAAIYKFIKKTNPILQVNNLDRDQKNYILESLKKMNTVLRIFRLQGCPLGPEVDALIKLREKARIEKDWGAADAAREELERQGITVIDTESGPVWKRVKETE